MDLLHEPPSRHPVVFWLRLWEDTHTNYTQASKHSDWAVVEAEEEGVKMASVSISGLRRNIKNVAHNYTDAQVLLSLPWVFTAFSWKYAANAAPQVKVREATSNDPWGPSSTQMSEIADLTYNMVRSSLCMIFIFINFISGGVLGNNADDLETIKWPRQELATRLQGFGAPWVSYKDWQWEGKA